MLPFEPESIDSARARYYKAIAWTLDITSPIRESDNPGSRRECVFDFKEGLRLIVSREITPEICVIHFSASADRHSSLYNSCEAGLVSVKNFCNKAVARYRDISGDARPARFMGLSPGKGVPHWYVTEEWEGERGK